jgi:acetyl esterase/lipase
MKRSLVLLVLLFLARLSHAQEPQPQLDVPYGSHPRQVLDFYPAKSDQPTPVVFYIHGGGWQNGDKKTNPKPFLRRAFPLSPSITATSATRSKTRLSRQ